jgi:hypothetical protein
MSVAVPGLKDSLVFPGTNTVNGNAPEVLALSALVEASGTDSVGTDVIKLVSVTETGTGRNRR